jgi:hypothetical protein
MIILDVFSDKLKMYPGLVDNPIVYIDNAHFVSTKV